MKEDALLRTVIIPATFVTVVLGACTSMPQQTSQVGDARPEVCAAVTEKDIASLFDRWNNALQTGDPTKVVAQYAQQSILLPTLSNKPRLTPVEKEDYFRHFLENKPSGRIDMRQINLGCNSAKDAGLYTFTFAKTGAQVKARYTYTYTWDGKDWLITSHHSSLMPETK